MHEGGDGGHVEAARAHQHRAVARAAAEQVLGPPARSRA